MADVMKRMSGLGLRGRMQAMKELTEGGMLDPGAKFSRKKKSTGKRLTPKERQKLRKQREKELRRKRREARPK